MSSPPLTFLDPPCFRHEFLPKLGSGLLPSPPQSNTSLRHISFTFSFLARWDQGEILNSTWSPIPRLLLFRWPTSTAGPTLSPESLSINIMLVSSRFYHTPHSVLLSPSFPSRSWSIRRPLAPPPSMSSYFLFIISLLFSFSPHWLPIREWCFLVLTLCLLFLLPPLHLLDPAEAKPNLHFFSNFLAEPS